MELFEFCLEIIKREAEKFNVGVKTFTANELTSATASDVNYDIANNRCAFLYRLGTINFFHARNCFSKFISDYKNVVFLMSNWMPCQNLSLCTFSEGPALDYIALLSSYQENGLVSPFFKNIKVVTKNGGWKNTASLMRKVIGEEHFKNLLASESTGNINVIQGDPFKDFSQKVKKPVSTSDVVLMMKTLNLQAELLNDEKSSKFIQNFLDVLKPGAIIFCMDTKPSINEITRHLCLYPGHFLFKPISVSSTVNLKNTEFYKDIFDCHPVISARGNFFVWQKSSGLKCSMDKVLDSVEHLSMVSNVTTNKSGNKHSPTNCSLDMMADKASTGSRNLTADNKKFKSESNNKQLKHNDVCSQSSEHSSPFGILQNKFSITKKESKCSYSQTSNVSPKKETKCSYSQTSNVSSKKETKCSYSQTSNVSSKKEIKCRYSRTSNASSKKETKCSYSQTSNVSPKKETKCSYSQTSNVSPKKETKCSYSQTSTSFDSLQNKLPSCISPAKEKIDSCSQNSASGSLACNFYMNGKDYHSQTSASSFSLENQLSFCNSSQKEREDSYCQTPTLSSSSQNGILSASDLLRVKRKITPGSLQNRLLSTTDFSNKGIQDSSSQGLEYSSLSSSFQNRSIEQDFHSLSANACVQTDSEQKNNGTESDKFIKLTNRIANLTAELTGMLENNKSARCSSDNCLKNSDKSFSSCFLNHSRMWCHQKHQLSCNNANHLKSGVYTCCSRNTNHCHNLKTSGFNFSDKNIPAVAPQLIIPLTNVSAASISQIVSLLNH